MLFVTSRNFDLIHNLLKYFIEYSFNYKLNNNFKDYKQQWFLLTFVIEIKFVKKYCQMITKIFIHSNVVIFAIIHLSCFTCDLNP